MAQVSPPNVTPAAVQAAFARSLELIHRHPEQVGLIHAATREWYDIFHHITGIDAFDFNGSPAITLATGKAIGPSGAAHCLLEGQRTAVFLRGIEHAIRDQQQRFPGRRIRILYAGCGPFASLLTPLTARFSAAEVGWHLLEVNERSLAAARSLYTALELTPWLLGAELADAADYTLPAAEPFHIVLSETMQRALQTETQLAITLNPLPQLAPGALFLPQSILVSAAVQQPGPAAAPGAVSLPVYQAFAELYDLCAQTAGPPQVLTLTVPTLDQPRTLWLTTRVKVYKDQALSGNDSSITLPSNLKRQVAGGERLVFRYDWLPRPGFRCEPAT